MTSPHLKPDETHARLAAIVEASDAAIVNTTVDDTIVSWNRAAETVFGYRADEAIGQPFAMLVPPELLAEERAVLARVAAGERVEHIETRRRRRDGAIAEISFTIAPVVDARGQVVGMTRVARDRTLPPQSERARAHLAAIVDSSDDAIVSKTLEGVIESWNAGAERIFGYTAAEAVGRPITMIIPAERLAEETEVLRKIRAGERVSHFETVRVRKDGTSVDISLAVSPIRDALGRIIGASKIARDVTKQRQLERERAALLRDSERANRGKDELLAMLGHELRNPLGAVLSAVQVLEDGESDASARERAVAVIARQARQLGKLVDDLLDVGRVLAGKINLEIGPLDLAEAVAVHLAAASMREERRHHRVVTDLTSVWAAADPVRFEQIVANLIDNAVKYSPGGTTITVTTRREGDEAALIVTDEGVGIPPELLPNVFDLFSQGERPLARSRGGLGIGLTLVRRLVQLHEGRIEVNSEGENRGTEVAVRLPVSDASRQTNVATPTRLKTPARRVLIVEDSDDGREMLRALLERRGHTVVDAADGGAGLELALREPPDVAILDLGLPVLDGYAVAQGIRASGSTMRLIALSGYGSAEHKQRARDAGFDAHLTKPVDARELERLLADEPPREPTA